MRNRLLIAVIIAVMMFATTAFAQTSQTINLRTGFNFVSLTTVISLTPLQFKTNYTQVDDIYLYSAAAGSFLSANDGSLTTLAAGRGYIIKSKTDGVITLSGTAPSTIGNITLKQGFNLVGFSKTLSQTMTFSQIMTAYGQIHGIYKWSPAAGSFLQVVRNVSNSQVTQLDGVDPSFKEGESYFINTDRDTTINYDGTAIVVGDGSTVPYTPPAQTEISGVPVQFLTDLGTEAKAGVGDIEGSIAQPTAAPAFDIVGRVITIKSISNIKVWIKDHPEINTTTDENGKFTLKDVPAAAKGEGHTLEYEKTEGNDKFKGVIADVPAVEKKKVDLKAYIGPQVIKPAATIQGKVALSDSLSPIGADVYIPGISGMVAKVDEDGSFSLMYVPVGTYTVAFHYFGYELTKQSVTVEAAEFKQLSTVVLRKITLANTLCAIDGYVTDADNAPVVSTNVSLISSDGKTDIAVVTSTTGRFQFKGLDAGTYKLVFTKDGYKGAQQSVSVTAGQEKQTNQTLEKVVVSAASSFGMIGGYVKDQMGAPLRNAVVMTIPPTQQFFTDNNGFFTLLITPGDYTLVVKRAGFKEDSVTCKVFEDMVTEVEAVLENLDTTVVASVELNIGELTVKQDESFQLVATLKDASSNILYGKYIEWTSSNTAVGTVSPSGLFTAKSAGTCVITAKSGDKTATANVTVASSAVTLTKLELFPVTATMKLSEIKHFTLVGTFSDGRVKIIMPSIAQWSASNELLYTADAGSCMAIGSGSSTLTVTFGGKTASSTITIGSVLVDDRPPMINHAHPLIEAGKDLLISASVIDNVGVGKVVLYYKTPGDAFYTIVDMAKSGEAAYGYTVPASQITVSGIQYYIHAEDNKTPTPNAATFPSNGINYPIILKPLVLGELILSRNVDTVSGGSVYDLTLINVLAKYQPTETVKLIAPVWTVKSGGGTIAGGSYTAPLTGGTVVLTASYTENGVSKTADLTLTVSASTAEVTIQSVNVIADKNVANGTALASVGLPATVKVTMSDATTREVAVTWDGATPAYNATTAGTYTFSGTIADTTLKASLKVIVAEAAAAATIQSIETIADRNVDNGTALSAISLPAKVVVTMTDASTKEVAVTWDGATPAYNATTAGTYTFSGTIADTTLKASLKVIVAEAAAATITSLAVLNDKTVEVGTTLAGLNLPAQITATLSDSTTAAKNVTWDGGTPAYNSAVAGTYIFSGTVADTTLKAQLTVVVIAVPSETATIKSINALTDISVLNGTSLAAVNLPTTVTVTMSNNTTRDVAVTWDGGSPAYSSTTAGAYTFSGTVADTTLKAQVCVVVSSSSTAAAELLIYTIEDLYAVRGEVAGHDGWNLGRNYKLMANLDFNSAASYSDPATYQSYFTTGKGWEPIGATDTPFYGTFDGNGHTVSNIMITDTSGNKGLFGVSRGQIKNLGVVNPKIEISGTATIKNIGGLVGENNGMVRNCFVTGTDTSYIKATNYVENIGGLAGYNNASGVIHDSYAGITVSSGYYHTGGLVGLNNSTVYNGIARCHATGNVSLNRNYNNVCHGGLIGKNGDTSGKVHYIVDSYATGNVDDNYTYEGSAVYAGGLIGNAYAAKSIVNNCYATGNVTSKGGRIGGLIGIVSQYGEINNSYATGAVTGTYNIGGLVGEATNCTITGSHATGVVTSSHKSTTNYCTGGLIGIVSNYATITVKDSYATGNVSDDSPGNYSGGLIGSINTAATKATISDCYASGSVTSKKYAGGLIGFAGVKATVTRCYATGDTTGTLDTGGLIAYSNAAVNQCYASGTVKCDGGTSIETGTGGLVGTNGTGTITACYALNPMIIKYTTITSNYFSRVVGRCDLTSSLTANYANSAMIYRVIDKEDTTSFPGLMANSTTSIKGANVTLANAKTRASYEGNNWDFSYWRISEGIDFPKLSWQ